MGEDLSAKTATSAIVVHPVRQTAKDHGAHDYDPDLRLEEAVGLAEAVDLQVKEARILPLRQIRAPTFLGPGHIEDIKTLIDIHHADLVIVDDHITPGQQRNLEKAWQAKVVDRTGLILEIFALRARTREGRLQVELARLEYERSRLVRTWTHLERQRGGFGFMGGPGETQIEADRRLLRDRITKLKKELKAVERTRHLHRQARKRVPYPIVALVGYTNAGKSTLFNTLTGAQVLAKDMVFATLDPTLRAVELKGGRQIILSDTVGFIVDLPTELVAAFRATLEEVIEADVIVHVRDIAAKASAEQAADVEDTLATLLAEQADDKTVLTVWNKIDKLDAQAREITMSEAQQQGVICTSALTGEGLESLKDKLSDLVYPEDLYRIATQHSDGRERAWLLARGRLETIEDRDDGRAELSIWLTRKDYRQYCSEFGLSANGQKM